MNDIVQVARRHAKLISGPVERGLVPGDDSADLILKLSAEVEKLRALEPNLLLIRLTSLTEAALDILANPPSTDRGREAWAECIREMGMDICTEE